MELLIVEDRVECPLEGKEIKQEKCDKECPYYAGAKISLDVSYIKCEYYKKR